MEEDTIDLIDGFRVIWKRKILIIVGTLVCIVVGVAVSWKLPETYRAEAIMKVGKTLTSFFPPLIPLDTPENLTKSIPIEYGLNNEEGDSKLSLKVEVVTGTSFIKLVMKGHEERKAKELLKEIVERIIVDHNRITEKSIKPYSVFIEKLETDIKMIQKKTAQLEGRLKEKNNEETAPVIAMLVRNDLEQGRINKISIRNTVFKHKMAIDTLKENKTRLVGEVIEICVKPKKRRNIILAGVVGLTISLFLAFLMEYLGKEVGKTRVRGKDNSA